MIWFLPVERLQQRYTAQMFDWVMRAAASFDMPIRAVIPDAEEAAPPVGEFLDLAGSTVFKQRQIADTVELIRSGTIKTGDVILIGDLWMTGIESIRFAAEAKRVRLVIAGWHYAGMFDPHDGLHRVVGSWASNWEARVLSEIVDLVCVGSQFHKNIILSGICKVAGDVAANAASQKIVPLGLCWYPSDVLPLRSQRRNVVAFPHRISPEKDPSTFIRLATDLKERSEFLILTPRPLPETVTCLLPPWVQVHAMKSKSDYYAKLASCSVLFSSARQETFGYAVHEAIALGLSVVAPNRCCYAETLDGDGRFLYEPDNYQSALCKMIERIEDPVPVPYSSTERYENSTRQFISMAYRMGQRIADGSSD
jgi:glycosyltransferase involved in cell wall biosynthesis